MASRKSKSLKTALLGKGFRYTDSDHVFLILYVNGKRTSIRTKISRGVDEYGDDLLAKMSRQLHVTKSDLLRLVDCPMTHEQYVSIVQASGHLKPE